MRIRFHVRELLGYIGLICLLLGLVSYGSPVAVAVGCDVIAIVALLSETLARWTRWPIPYVLSPKRAREWLFLVMVLLVVNGAAFYPDQRNP